MIMSDLDFFMWTMWTFTSSDNIVFLHPKDKKHNECQYTLVASSDSSTSNIWLHVDNEILLTLEKAKEITRIVEAVDIIHEGLGYRPFAPLERHIVNSYYKFTNFNRLINLIPYS